MVAEPYSWIYEALVFHSRLGYFTRRHFSGWPGVLEWFETELGAGGVGVFDRAVVTRLCMDEHGFVYSEGRVKLRTEDFAGLPPAPEGSFRSGPCQRLSIIVKVWPSIH
ncbi:hypothetical protein [Streptomyces sioyaensis]|uniref:hypothetical protein n=1 Tax=Streptomyces sioyaensis TaxID=67364 RepID=UPI003D715F67